ncbi:MAG: hypothetical protein KGL04_10345, partial [Elusimicrobia bacterium]|nr:hypothetical protein [Elusimicrobiota bacterium]
MQLSLIIAGSLCLVLAAVLAWAIGRISALKKSQAWAAPEPDSEKLDLLLSSLLSLQQKGIARSGTVSKEEFGQAVLDNACQLMG